MVALFCLTKMHQSLQTGQFLDFLPIDAFRRQNVRYAAGRRGLRDVPIAGHSRWCIVPSRRHSALLCCDRSRLVPVRRQNQGDELSAVEPVPSEEPLLVGTASVVETNVGNVIGRQVIDLWRKQERAPRDDDYLVAQNIGKLFNLIPQCIMRIKFVLATSPTTG